MGDLWLESSFQLGCRTGQDMIKPVFSTAYNKKTPALRQGSILNPSI